VTFAADWEHRLLGVTPSPALALILMMFVHLRLLFAFSNPGFVLPAGVRGSADARVLLH